MNTIKTTDKILLIGVGNDGRGDDALGWKFADTFSVNDDLFDVVYRYQLQIEDADLIKQYKTVIFADAHHEELPDGFIFYSCRGAYDEYFTSHALKPENLILLCSELYNIQPDVWVMAITGKEWELNFGLSPNASANLDRSIIFFTKIIQPEKKQV